MLFLKRILARWVSEGSDSESDHDSRYPPVHTKRQGHVNSIKSSGGEGIGTDFKNPLNITLYNAMGGRIVKFHSYDRQSDHTVETTYIIPSDEDFEVSLGKFITLEAMKHTND